jgi:hypothetical protein
MTARTWIRRLFARKPRIGHRNPDRCRTRPLLEALEDRVLMTLGNPVWVNQGPAPLLSINTPADSGAINAVAVDPNNPARAFIASTDGGIWRTTNLTAVAPATPTWTPLTDQLPFLGTTDVEFSPSTIDPTNNTLFVSTGRVASSFQQSGPSAGIYRTTNAGDATVNWTVLGAATFTGLTITDVVPTTVVAPGSGPPIDRELVLAATAPSPLGGNDFAPANVGPVGLYRSADGGQTWTLVSGTGGLPAGAVSQVVADNFNPAQPRFYAAVPGQGIYSSNDGVTWLQVTGNAQITGIGASRRITLAVHNSAGNDVLYAAVVGSGRGMTGIFRSPDQGATWTAMGLPTTGNISGPQGLLNASIVADPNDPLTVYVGGSTPTSPPFNGIHFRGSLNTAGPVTRLTVTNAGAGYAVPPTVQITGGGGFGATAIATVDAQGSVLGIVITNPGRRYNAAPTVQINGGGGNGATAVAMPPNAQGQLTAINVNNMGAGYNPSPIVTFTGGGGTGAAAVAAVDQDGRVADFFIFDQGAGYTSAPAVTIAGNGNGATATATVANFWSALDGPSANGAGANGTSTHSDSRNMVFDSKGPNAKLLEVDDGGIYSLNTPGDAATRRWSPLDGNLSINEASFVAYDSVNHVVYGGAQDNGTPLQTAPDATGGFTDVTGGDGLQSAVDNTSMPGFSIHYTSNQGRLYRNVYNAADAIAPGTPGVRSFDAEVPLFVNGSNRDPNGPRDTLPNFDPTVNRRFIVIPFALNAVDPTQMLLGTNYIYTSNDSGRSVTPVDGIVNGELQNDRGTITALAYGGFRTDGTQNPNIAYVGTDGSGPGLGGTPRLLIRTLELGNSFVPLTSYPGSTPRDIVMDPNDYRVIYVLDMNSRIWRCANTTLANPTFVEITGNLGSLLTDVRTITIFRPSAGAQPVLLVGGLPVAGRQGGVAGTDAPANNGPVVWTTFGSALPNTLVTDLTYDSTDNVLAASTFGRGFWKVTQASNFAGQQAPVVSPLRSTVTFTAGGPAVAIAPAMTVTDANSPTLARVVVQLTNPLDGASEQLAVANNVPNINVSAYNPANGRLVLTGQPGATLIDFQAAVQELTYQDSAAAPAQDPPRVISIVANDGFVGSTYATVTVSIANPANNAPFLTNNGTFPVFLTGGPPVAVAPAVTVQNPGGNSLNSATVTITNLLDGNNEALAANPIAGMTSNYTATATTGTLTLTGPFTLAQYQQVLRTVTYQDTAASPNRTPRRITIVVSGGVAGGTTSLPLGIDLRIQLAHQAPVIAGNPAFAVYPESPVINTGTPVDALLRSGRPRGSITDPDPNADLGIAVVGMDNGNGSWQYSVDGGQTWQNFALNTSDANALLLGDNPTSMVRFLPNAGFVGTVAGGLRFRAWDQSTGLPQATINLNADGSTADTTVNGGSTAFSTAMAAASVTVLPPNFVFDPGTLGLAVTAGAASNTFNFSQATTADPFGLVTTYSLMLNGTTQTFDSSVLRTAVVTGVAGAASQANLTTSDTYVGLDGVTRETAEAVRVGNDGGKVQKFDSNGVAVDFLTLTGFQSVFGVAGPVDQGFIDSTPGTKNVFVGAGSYAYMNTGFNAERFYYITGAGSVQGIGVARNDPQYAQSFAYNYDGNGPSRYIVSGIDSSQMVGTDKGRNFNNLAVDFPWNQGIATHAGDTATVFDSPGSDRFSGFTLFASMVSADGSSLENDSLATYVGAFFDMVSAFSFRGGLDTATVDPAAANRYRFTGFLLL